MTRRRDRGAVLPLVLVMVIVGALIVLPVLRYAVAVLKANSVQSERTKSIEAAKGGIRVALDDPADVFHRCNNTADLTPASGVIPGRTVTVQCTEVKETGPLEVLGFEVPHGAVAMQLGATVPTSFSGTKLQSPAVPPYPVAPDDEAWWDDPLVDPPDDQWSYEALAGTIWLPRLPAVPSVSRSSVPFDMPAGFNCKVYLPGTYSDPVDLSGNVYFASGVYYFEDTVTVAGDADVVVGQGIEDFGTDCADDIQVAANIIGGPGTFSIDGGGGTWIFGDGGNLVIDNSTTATSLSIRFNQRYSNEPDRGERVSIMSVNGDDVAPIDHQVTDVVKIDRSTVYIEGQPPIALGQPGATYLPSSSTFTSKVRVPQPPATVTATTAHDDSAPPPDDGTALVTWSEVIGQDAGGALIDGYDVTVSPSVGPVCAANEVIPSGAGEFSCLVRGLTIGTSYSIEVAARNEAGSGTPSASVVVTPELTDPDVMPPDEPTIIAVDPYDDAADVSWAAPADNGSPIVQYDVRAYRVYLEPVVPATDPPTFVENAVEVGNCSTTASAWEPAAENCVVTGLADLVAPPGVDPDDGFENVGYRFSVTATNALGASTETIVDPPGGIVFAYDGDAPPPPPDPLVRIVEPWIPQPIIDVRATGAASTTLSVAGHVAIPMGRLNVDNPNGLDIKINGGVVASTFAVNDSREDLAVPGSLPIGFKNDIVLQRTVRMVATADNVRSIAIVQINEDGASYRLNAWVTQ